MDGGCHPSQIDRCEVDEQLGYSDVVDGPLCDAGDRKHRSNSCDLDLCREGGKPAVDGREREHRHHKRNVPIADPDIALGEVPKIGH